LRPQIDSHPNHINPIVHIHSKDETPHHKPTTQEPVSQTNANFSVPTQAGASENIPVISMQMGAL
jgi:hypothetical protein